MDQLNTEETKVAITTYFSRSTYNLLTNEGNCQIIILFLSRTVLHSEEVGREFLAFCHFMDRGNKEIIRRYPAFLKLLKEVVRRLHQSKNQISDDKLCLGHLVNVSYE